jgi:nitrogen fixation protein NifZ
VLPRWDYGDAVRVTRNVRNDGTFPGVQTGDLLVRRGRIGHVRDVGTFLQNQIIYSVHFLDEGRLVGCREEELIGADAPWIESRFEVRQKVRAYCVSLVIRGEIRVALGSRGEILNLETIRERRASSITRISTACRQPPSGTRAALGEWERDDA